jgi:spectinomycin phosphotransferase
MRALPEGLEESELRAALVDGWGVEAAVAAYVPVGGGSYHWRVEDVAHVRHWVNVDDLDHKGYLGTTRETVFDALRRAFDSACAARDGGLDFVVAPSATLGGASVYRLSPRYAMTTFSFIETPAGQFGERRTAAERAALVDALARLHRNSPVTARVEQAEVPHRTLLERALTDLDRPWSSGPYAERARSLLRERADAIRQLFRRFDLLGDRLGARPDAFVLTHGEPHPGNVVFVDGRVLLIDWDTAALARPERDLWMFDSADQRVRYTEQTGRAVDDEAIELYRLRWTLDDITSVVFRLYPPHEETPDTARTWNWAVDSFGTYALPYGPG